MANNFMELYFDFFSFIIHFNIKVKVYNLFNLFNLQYFNFFFQILN
jgi:hypothetical protein